MWHASIAIRSEGGLVPWARCGLKTRDIVRRTVIGMLAGVGTGETRRDRSEHVLHARRKLAAQELALLSPAWCEISAVDIAGGGKPW